MRLRSEEFARWVHEAEAYGSDGLRLLCFPYSGGSASVFRSWPAALPKAVQVCAVQPPGREMRLMEPPFTRLEPLLEVLATIISHYRDRPYALFGHSLGALVAFELARHVRRLSLPGPVGLFVSGSRGPRVPRREDPVYNLPEPEFRAKLRELGGTPEEVLAHAELMSVVGPLIRADYEIYDTYRYAPDEPLSCPLSAFGGVDDVEVTHEDLEAWREHTTGGFRLRMLPGNHLFINQTRDLLLAHIGADLREWGIIR